MKQVAVITGCVCVLTASLLTIAIHSAKMQHRTQCANSVRHNMQVIQQALHNYRDVYSAIPENVVKNEVGTPICSWRQAIGYYVFPGAGSLDPDEAFWSSTPWNDSKFTAYDSDRTGIPFLYGSDCTPRRETETCMLALIGDGTAYGFLIARTGSGIEEGVRRQPTADDAIILVEVDHSGINWRQPGDLDIRTMPREINPTNGVGISGALGDRIHVGFVDGEVWAISSKVPFEMLEKFFTVEGAGRWDREELLGPYRVN